MPVYTPCMATQSHAKCCKLGVKTPRESANFICIINLPSKAVQAAPMKIVVINFITLCRAIIQCTANACLTHDLYLHLQRVWTSYVKADREWDALAL